MRLGWKGVLGLLVSVVLIWWTLRGVDFAEVWQVVREGHMGLLALSVAIATAGFLIRALRWGVLLRPLKASTSLDARFGAVSIGFMGNNLLPARMGEFVRAYAFSRMESVSVSGVFGTLVVERFLDGLILFAFLIVPMMLPGFPGAEQMQDGGISLVVRGVLLAMIVVVLLLGALLLWPARVVRAVERLARFLPGGVGRTAVDALEAFLEALGVLRHPRLLLAAAAWSVGFWAFHGLSFWSAMAAFGIHEGFAAALFTEAVVGFGVALPSAPGFFGTFHASANWALGSVYGADPARALAFAYGFHLGGFIPVTLIGLWYARRMGLSLEEMSRSEQRVEEAVEAAHPEAVGSSGVAPPPGPVPARGARLRAVEIDAPAKVNLFLHVMEREASGYHGIQTLFQALEWGDRLRVAIAGEAGVRVLVEGYDVGPTHQNLVHRAALAMLERAGVGLGVEIRLEKRVPPGSGLGGGSSDAAATLKALARLLDDPPPPAALRELAAGLGSDVPFFLGESPLALGSGRGERLVPLPPLPAAPVLVALPPVEVSTGEAYRALDARRHGEPPLRRALGPPPGEGPSWAWVRERARNDFEEVVLEAHPAVAEAREALARTDARLVLLSGSGGAVFAVYEDEGAARAALEELRKDHPATGWILTRTARSWPLAR